VSLQARDGVHSGFARLWHSEFFRIRGDAKAPTLAIILPQDKPKIMSSSATMPAVFTAKTILKYRPFRTLWLAQFVSIFGDFLALFGVISLITFSWHGTPVQVTTVTIAFVLPMAVISPIAGVFVDHWNVKRLMIASDLIRAALILMLVFVHSVPQISAIFVVLSSVSSFFAPAQSVTLRTIVPAEGLLSANALMMQAL
jgi:DHA3 family macrolide efflux protein-like MFS transporter